MVRVGSTLLSGFIASCNPRLYLHLSRELQVLWLAHIEMSWLGISVRVGVRVGVRKWDMHIHCDQHFESGMFEIFVCHFDLVLGLG